MRRLLINLRFFRFFLFTYRKVIPLSLSAQQLQTLQDDLSVDGAEGRFAIAPKGEVMTPLDGPTGFTVRRTQ